MGFKHFNLQLKTTLPRLSWCAQVRRLNPTILVYHGPWVEVGNDFFCEGAWSDEFSRCDFPNALFFTGSGGSFTETGVMFSTPSHTLEAVYLLFIDDSCILSNSLTFLLSQAGDDIDPGYKFYLSDISSIKHGLQKYIKRIPTKKKNWIHLYYYCNIEIDNDLKIIKKDKPVPPAFKKFSDYRDFLLSQIDAVVKNAASPLRKIQYQPIATISSGYDSPASAVLAKSCGCTQALTYKMSRGGEDDSGKEIARILGYNIQEFDRNDYRKLSGFPEAEFYAVGSGGEDMVMASLKEVLSGRLVFTGFHGGNIWNRLNKKIGPYIIRGDVSGSSLKEFRLRVGFLNLDVPLIGCLRHAQINEIANSAEMYKWRTEGNYDRPIPRRIIEEAGVPRHLFGRRKNAITQCICNVGKKDRSLAEVLTEESYEDFCGFLKNHPLFKNNFEQGYLCMMRNLYWFNDRIINSFKLNLIFKKLRKNLPSRPIIAEKFRKIITKDYLVFYWAVNKIKQRYQLNECFRTQ